MHTKGVKQLGDRSDDQPVISIELVDVYQIYSGEPVFLGGRRLSACYLSVRDPLHREAMEMLGVAPGTAYSLTREVSIVKNQIYEVGNIEEMQECIRSHHPALGYLPEEMHADGVAPCF